MAPTAPASPGSTARRRVPTLGAPADEAVARLLDLYGPRIRALAHRLCRNHADADDAVQDTFLRAFRKWHTFRGDADPGTWLYAIAVRECRARRKRDARRRTPAMSQLMPWSETTVAQFAAARADEPHEAERRESVERVHGAIADLPEHLRVPVLLKDVLGVRVEDVAGALGLAENTVKTRLHRARLALRKAMTARAPSVDAPPPIFEKQVCLDLLKTKLDAMDRGGAAAGFLVPQAEVCARCRAVFRELDLVQDACTQLASGDLPDALRSAILRAIAARDAAPRAARRGRRPVRRSRPRSAG
ncbi:MAG: RNA polymerase sigma factor [Planctomycetota bacterium]|nr:RNA polymerase sigma factor [Planctomycetota bacterium]